MYANQKWTPVFIVITTFLLGSLNANAQTIPTRTPTRGGESRPTNTPTPWPTSVSTRRATNTPWPTRIPATSTPTPWATATVWTAIEIPHDEIDAFIVILDASWSMTSPPDSTEHLTPDDPDSRMVIAKRGLTTIINRTLPRNTPFALRAFGNEAGNLACRTDMAYRLQLLDRTEAVATINGIEPQYNASSALTAAIQKIPDDLSDFEGSVKLVLLTDGRDTCGGDPLAAIIDLRIMRPGTTIDVVGFEVENSALKIEMEAWAEAGGGEYHGIDDVDSATMAFATTFGMGQPTAVGIVQNKSSVPIMLILSATISVLMVTTYQIIQPKS